METLIKALSKYGTILVDRRFIVGFLVPTLLILVGGPELANRFNSANPQTADTITLIMTYVIPLLGGLGVSFSWQKRPPQGLDYKTLSFEAQELLEAARKTGMIK